LYGEGVFETLRAYDGAIPFLNLHYYRLRESCRALGLDLPLDEFAFGRMLKQLIHRNRLADAYMRVTVSASGLSLGMDLPRHLPVQVVAFCRPLHERPARWYARGAKLIIAQTVTADQPRLAMIKSTNYLSKMFARREANAVGAADALIKDVRGKILEGSASSLFAIRGGRLTTPPISDGILPGVTRSVVLGIADTLDIPWREIHFTEKTLQQADEIFVTGSTSEVLPIAEVIGICKTKAPGPITKLLTIAYKNLVTNHNH
ncbi:MAG: aminotransferase class IV, partial [Sideroxyarcus sp.]|nr:aminotransferase class IV [Sideroxyarcus sp.]